MLSHRRSISLIAMWLLVATGTVAIGATGASAGHITSIEVSPVAVFPAFDEDVSDYAMRCADGLNHLEVTVVATATNITVDGVPAASGEAEATTVLEDQVLTIAVTDGGGTKEYFYRCLPADFPTYTVDKPGTPDPGFYLMAFGLCINACPTTGGNFIALVDTNGVPVWYKRTRLPVVDQKIRSDGTIAFFEFDLTEPRDTALRSSENPLRDAYQINTMDGAFVRPIRADGIPTDLHELIELANGNDLVMSYVDNTRYLPFIDGYLQELDADGDMVWEWRSQDHIGDDENTIPASNDLVHLNSAEELPGGDILISARSAGVYRISRVDGSVVWKLGGTTTDESLTIIGDTNHPGGPDRQHDVRLLDDGTILMHDNRVAPGEAARTVGYEIDEGLGTATMVWEHVHPTGNASFFIGSARRQPVLGVTGAAAGNTVIGWGGTQPMVDEVDIAGARQFAITAAGEQEYRVVKYPVTDFDIDELRALAGGAMEYDVPTDVVVIGGDRQATVSWTAPTVGQPIAGYTVRTRPAQMCTTTGATSCVVTGLTTGETYTFVVEADNKWKGTTSLASLPSEPVVIPDLVFVPVAPYRLEDTRQGDGEKVGSPDGSAAAFEFNVLGRGGLPTSGIGAVSLNVTVDQGELPDAGFGYVTVDACESPRPTASNLNFDAGQTVPNAVVTPVSPDGDVCVYVYGTAHILVDVNGYFPDVSDFESVRPHRLEDTRGGPKVGSADGSAGPLKVKVTGEGGVPASGVAAVSLNVTVDQGELPDVGFGYVTVDGCETPRPTASNLNFDAGQTVPNAVITPVSASGEICLYVYGTAHILVDVNGYFPDGSDFGSLRPHRLEDTRGGPKVGSADGSAGPLRVQVTGEGGVPASGVAAVSLNVTVDQGELPTLGGGYVTVDGCVSPRPTASNLNFGAGQTVPNVVLTPVSDTGEVCIYVYGTADILVDVNGYFPDGSGTPPRPATRPSYDWSKLAV